MTGPEDAGNPPRYAPERGYPPYAFMPGRNPHPREDPGGHSYGAVEDDPDPVSPADWAECGTYLHGVDLYNAGFLWEAHEAWEALWLASRHDPVQFGFLQGLIQCSAGALKAELGRAEGLRRLAEEGTAKIAAATSSGPVYMGLDAAAFTAAYRAWAATKPDSAEARPRILLEATSR